MNAAKTEDKKREAEKLKADALASQGVSDQLLEYLRSSFSDLNSMLDKVLKKSLFVSNPTMYRKLKISLLFNFCMHYSGDKYFAA